MYDFKLILGLSFLRDTRGVVLPRVNLLAMQFEKGCKRNEPSFLCTLHFEKIESKSGLIPDIIKKLLKEFEDVMLDELPQKLPLKRVVDHELKLVPGTKAPKGTVSYEAGRAQGA
ncbi:hypothetical protein ACS0TY_003446 [Phlomoides rotata]